MLGNDLNTVSQERVMLGKNLNAVSQERDMLGKDIYGVSQERPVRLGSELAKRETGKNLNSVIEGR
jgi:hypothetical protein